MSTSIQIQKGFQIEVGSSTGMDTTTVSCVYLETVSSLTATYVTILNRVRLEVGYYQD